MLTGSLVLAADTRLARVAQTHPSVVLQVGKLSLVPPRAAAQASDSVSARGNKGATGYSEQ